jgi:hypothetical protein
MADSIAVASGLLRTDGHEVCPEAAATVKRSIIGSIRLIPYW